MTELAGTGTGLPVTGWMGDAETLLANTRAEMSPGDIARRAAERADRAAAIEAAEEQARREDELQQRLFQMRMTGVAARSVADIQRAAIAAGDEDAAYEEAKAVMERIDRRRSARAEAARFEAEKVAAVAQRSATLTGNPDLLAEAKRVMARQRVDEMLARGTRSRPPFARRGVAVRAETVTCQHCIDVGANPAESFLIHHEIDRAPVPADSVPADTRYCRGCGSLRDWCTCTGAAGRAGNRDYGMAVR